eukprot:gb/GEZN01010927.1/.p2 GENE.gb/GEZN01010927.1/~~gb/GEZN01010927.1/.p2  ORF type:complete len:139 (-),score=15.38 gb/GEZN01010927.1/:30-446(-)
MPCAGWCSGQRSRLPCVGWCDGATDEEPTGEGFTQEGYSAYSSHAWMDDESFPTPEDSKQGVLGGWLTDENLALVSGHDIESVYQEAVTADEEARLFQGERIHYDSRYAQGVSWLTSQSNTTRSDRQAPNQPFRPSSH